MDRKMCKMRSRATPSRMATPKRAFQLLPTDSGSARQRGADAQICTAGACFDAFVVEHRREERRHAIRRWSGCLYLSIKRRTSPPASGRSAFNTWSRARHPENVSALPRPWRKQNKNRLRTVLPQRGRHILAGEALASHRFGGTRKDWSADDARLGQPSSQTE